MIAEELKSLMLGSNWNDFINEEGLVLLQRTDREGKATLLLSETSLYSYISTPVEAENNWNAMFFSKLFSLKNVILQE